MNRPQELKHRSALDDMGKQLTAQIDRELTQSIVEMPRRSKEIDCAGCGRPITVADRVCFAYCAKCSDGQGVKR